MKELTMENCNLGKKTADAMGLMLIWLKENGHLEDGK